MLCVMRTTCRCSCFGQSVAQSTLREPCIVSACAGRYRLRLGWAGMAQPAFLPSCLPVCLPPCPATAQQLQLLPAAASPRW